jgi:hypothetical protein
MLVFTAHLSESTDALVDPLVAVDLFTATRWVSWSRDSCCLSNDSVDLKLEIISELWLLEYDGQRTPTRTFTLT